MRKFFCKQTLATAVILFFSCVSIQAVKASANESQGQYYYGQQTIPHCMATFLRYFSYVKTPGLASIILKSEIAHRFARHIDRKLGERTFYTERLATLNPDLPYSHEMAFIYADRVRYLPEVHTFRTQLNAGQVTKADLDLALRRFLVLIPTGHQIVRSYTGPVTGLKYGLFKNNRLASGKGDEEPDYVLAFAPSQELNDWLANMSYGIDQVTHPEINRLVANIIQLRPNRISITGHSLGGGIAQGVAYQLQKAAGLANIKMHVELTSFNSFGAAEQIKWFTKNLSDTVQDKIQAAHYYIKGDPVAALGRHIGSLDTRLIERLRDGSRETLQTPTIGLEGPQTIGWNVHGIIPLKKEMIRVYEGKKASPAVEVPRSIQLGGIAQSVRSIVLTYKIARLQVIGHQVAKDLAALRTLYESIDLPQAKDLDWLRNEIMDLYLHFKAANDAQGAAILKPFVQDKAI